MRFSFVLLLALSVELSIAARLSTYAGPACTQNRVGAYDLNESNSWLSLCGSNVRSIVIPPNTTVAFYQQCRSSGHIEHADPRFHQIITSDRYGDCVTFYADEGESLEDLSISVQFIKDVKDVCKEYADHIDSFCDKSCASECEDSIMAAQTMISRCQSTQVSTTVWDSRHQGRSHNNKKMRTFQQKHGISLKQSQQQQQTQQGQQGQQYQFLKEEYQNHREQQLECWTLMLR
eukprot:GILJ01025133.1.p1 GENE.GILJ01025133.1~~GILJ01025133.1.p1  ORF type:complete len:246 (+),score=17.62 GILJ01025133.1:41-739(+)